MAAKKKKLNLSSPYFKRLVKWTSSFRLAVVMAVCDGYTFDDKNALVDRKLQNDEHLIRLYDVFPDDLPEKKVLLEEMRKRWMLHFLCITDQGREVKPQKNRVKSLMSSSTNTVFSKAIVNAVTNTKDMYEDIKPPEIDISTARQKELIEEIWKKKEKQATLG